ncbi:MAG: ATP cone domain-containing protein, partial [Pseudomonadota bacterium]
MAKLQVVDSRDGTAVPFLRGILTRSLRSAGLNFEEAYNLASEIRDDLADSADIAADDLKNIVAEKLASVHGASAAERYTMLRGPAVPIIVYLPGGQTCPFSTETHRRALESSGLSAELSEKISGNLYRHLVMRNRTEVTSSHIGRLTYRYLRCRVGKDTAQRFLVWREFNDQGWPLILLLGGAPGCGKSTIATEMASRLDIFRTQSTDMLREVMRMMIPERLMPVLYKSSFDAWQALPESNSSEVDENQVIRGYRSQAELIVVPCEAVVQRAVRERVSLVLEGVHVDAAMVNRLGVEEEDVVVVPIMLGVLKRQQLKNRIQGRGAAVPERRSKRYLKNFDAIWQLQAYLLDEADLAGVSIVANDDKQETINEIMRIIVD